VIGEGIGVIWEPHAVRGGSYDRAKAVLMLQKERGDAGTREERVPHAVAMRAQEEREREREREPHAVSMRAQERRELGGGESIAIIN
jgi:DNA invertase Pin-like site-specific DNA recombinase